MQEYYLSSDLPKFCQADIFCRQLLTFQLHYQLLLQKYNRHFYAYCTRGERLVAVKVYLDETDHQFCRDLLSVGGPNITSIPTHFMQGNLYKKL